MVLQDDIITRAVKQLVRGLLRAVGFRKQKDFPAARQELDELYTSLGLDAGLLRRVTGPTVRMMVTRGGEFDPALANAVADLLDEDAALHRDEGDAVAASVLEENARALRS